MGRPYSLDLRERVVTPMTAGMSGQKAAQHFSVGESSALRWARRARETGSPKAKPMGGTRPLVLEAHRRWIIVRLTEKPDLTLRALAAELKARGAEGSSFAVWSIMADAGLSFKKAGTPASKTGPTSRVGTSSGNNTRTRLTQSVWSSSMRLGSRPP